MAGHLCEQRPRETRYPCRRGGDLTTPTQSQFQIRTHRKCEMLDLTSRVADLVAEAGVKEGLCSVYVPHATAAVVINENDDPNLCDDVLDGLSKLIPDGIWRHDRIDANGAAHIKAAILGPSETIPVRDGRLLLGTWQAIMLVELDGPRDRRVIVTTVQNAIEG